MRSFTVSTTAWALGSAAMLLASVARADYGSDAIAIVCDGATGRVSVELHIIWNEALERFSKDNPTGELVAGPLYTKLYDKQQIRRTCSLGKRAIDVRVDVNGPTNFGPTTLSISEGGKPVLLKEIGYVWFAAGERYIVRSSAPHKWEECVGAEEGVVGHRLQCGELTNSAKTDMDGIDALRKMLPNKSLERTRER